MYKFSRQKLKKPKQAIQRPAVASIIDQSLKLHNSVLCDISTFTYLTVQPITKDGVNRSTDCKHSK